MAGRGGASPALGVRQLLELERALYQESIERAEQQREQLEEGTLEAFVLRCLPLETDRERELEGAKAQLQLNTRNGLDLLEFELQAAEDIFRGECRALRKRLLAQAQRRVRRLERRQKQHRESAAVPFRPALVDRLERERAKRLRDEKRNLTLPTAVDKETLVAELDGAQKDAQRAFNFRHMRFAVPPPERIATEVGETLRDFSKRVAAVEGSTEMDVSLQPDGQTLVCSTPDGRKRTSFHVDDSVVVVSRLSEEEFHGQIAEIVEHEVRVDLLCGNMMLISLDRLRDGRCVLRNLSEYHQPSSPTRAGAPVSNEIRASPSGRRQAAAEASRRRRKTTVDIRRGF